MAWFDKLPPGSIDNWRGLKEKFLNRFGMPVWCRMFQQTLDGKAMAWFDKLPPGSIDNWGGLQEKFLNRSGMLKACDKEPTEISKIVRRANETLPHFKERRLPRGEFQRKNVPVQLAQRNDRQQRYPYENNRRRQVHIPAFKAPKRNTPYVPSQRPNQEVRRPRAVLTLDSLSSTPQEILATEHQLRLPKPAPLDVRQRGRGGQRNNNPQKAKIINMVQCHSSDRKRKTIITDEKWMNVCIIFPSVLARDLSKEAVVVEAKVEGYLVRKIHIDEGAAVENMGAGEAARKIELDVCFGGSGRCRREILKFTIITAPPPYNIILGRPGMKQLRREGKKKAVEPPKKRKAQDTITLTNLVLVNPAYPEQLIMIGTGLSPEGLCQLKNLLKKNIDIFAWESSDMNGVPKRIIKHPLNANPLENSFSHKRRVICLEKNRVITEEVAEWLKAGIVRPVKCIQRLPSDTDGGIGRGKNKFLYRPRNAITQNLGGMQSLAKKLAALNRFLFRSAEKSLPFFETLKDITKENKHDYRWTEKAKNVFQELKKTILDLPSLATPLPKETLFVCLEASKEAVSVVLLVVRQGKQHPVHYVSRTLHDAERNYAPLEKWHWPYDTHPRGWLAEYFVELGAYNIMYEPRNTIKGANTG
nr:reverse transcriptase domain-containing protein [Tanacetum cinerariifolium]